MIQTQIPGSPLITSSFISTSCTTIAPVKEGSTTARAKCCGEGCKKKLGLTDFACKCKKMFCSVHRAAEAHACAYDYKADHNKELLKTMNDAVISRRVDII